MKTQKEDIFVYELKSDLYPLISSYGLNQLTSFDGKH